MEKLILAQEQSEPSGHFYGPLVTGKWAPQTGKPRLFVPGVLPRGMPQQSANSRCSVPL